MENNNRIGLLTSEKILWQGIPSKKKLGLSVPFIVFSAAVVLLTIYAFLNPLMGSVKYICIPILVVIAGYCLTVAYFEQKRKKNLFIITDMRVIRCDGVFSYKLSEYRYRQISDILLKLDRGNKSGSIHFRAKQGGPSSEREIIFSDIKDVITAYNLAQQQLSLSREREIQNSGV